jgi:hypothetical protein
MSSCSRDKNPTLRSGWYGMYEPIKGLEPDYIPLFALKPTTGVSLRSYGQLPNMTRRAIDNIDAIVDWVDPHVYLGEDDEIC